LGRALKKLEYIKHLVLEADVLTPSMTILFLEAVAEGKQVSIAHFLKEEDPDTLLGKLQNLLKEKNSPETELYSSAAALALNKPFVEKERIASLEQYVQSLKNGNEQYKQILNLTPNRSKNAGIGGAAAAPEPVAPAGRLYAAGANF
jgi:hypothetical protein